MEKNLKEMIEYPAEGILSKEIVKQDGLDVGLFCMAAGTEMSDHTSVKKGYVHVLEGKGIFTLEGKEIVMESGMFIFMEAGAVHGLKSEEDTAFILTLID
tara:strand:- start:233 stop:532 length:300 start_codon:yes stop_codon:yes gene_type:complete